MPTLPGTPQPAERPARPPGPALPAAEVAPLLPEAPAIPMTAPAPEAPPIPVEQPAPAPQVASVPMPPEDDLAGPYMATREAADRLHAADDLLRRYAEKPEEVTRRTPAPPLPPDRGMGEIEAGHLVSPAGTHGFAALSAAF